jgi:hypothetical protein
MTAQQWIIILVLGGIAGALGQVARVVVGLKKRHDAAAASGTPIDFDASKLIISIAIGFTAGAFAALAVEGASAEVTAKQVLGFAAAGYAGADFIEGIMQRSLPASGAPKGR